MAYRTFRLPQLDKPTYEALRDLCATHEESQWNLVSAAIVAFARLPRAARDEALAQFRGCAPSETPSHVIAP